MAIRTPDQAKDEAKNYLKDLLAPRNVQNSYDGIVAYYASQVKRVLSQEELEAYADARTQQRLDRRLAQPGAVSMLGLMEQFCLERGIFPTKREDLYPLLMPVLLHTEIQHIKDGLENLFSGVDTATVVTYADRQLGAARIGDDLYVVLHTATQALSRAFVLTASRDDSSFGILLGSKDYAVDPMKIVAQYKSGSFKGTVTEALFPAEKRREINRFPHAAAIWRLEDTIYSR